MPYDILTDDLYDNRGNKINPANVQGRSPLGQRIFGPMFIHIFLI